MPLPNIRVFEESSETSVDFQQTTERYTPEDNTLHNHRCENLKSYIVFLYGEATHSNLKMEVMSLRNVC
jgi:hypothetical protein